LSRIIVCAIAFFPSGVLYAEIINRFDWISYKLNPSPSNQNVSPF